ncbi:MAG: hypothetical protein IT435_02315 [Phycisphaerales bacterium]|nr:hypothetical protein [Phycisphaerales bacterium]
MPTPFEQLVAARIEDQKSRTDDVLALAALLIALLDESEPAVQVIIERYLTLLLRPGVRLESPSVQTMLANMRSEIEAARTVSFQRVRTRLELRIGEMVDAEWDRLVSLYDSLLGLALQRPLTSHDVIFDTPFLGRDFETWLTDLLASDVNRISDQVVIGLIQQRSRTQILQATLGEENLNGGNGATETTRSQLKNLVDTGAFAAIGVAIKLFGESNIDQIPRDLYIAVLDSRTTVICRSNHGKVFPVGRGPYPPLHWFCRSIRVGLPAEGDLPDVA